jgi:hypothetical protein
MSNLSEIQSLAQGLQYVIHHTKNRDLAKESIEKLFDLRSSAIAEQKRRSVEVVEFIDKVIEDGNMKIGFRPSDAAEYLESQTSTVRVLGAMVAYLIVLFTLSTYIFVVNQTISNPRFGKN